MQSGQSYPQHDIFIIALDQDCTKKGKHVLFLKERVPENKMNISRGFFYEKQ